MKTALDARFASPTVACAECVLSYRLVRIVAPKSPNWHILDLETIQMGVFKMIKDAIASTHKYFRHRW